MAYSTLDDIKRLLRILAVSGSNQHKVRFSNSYTLPEAFSGNDGSGILSGITLPKTDYAGSEYWWINFTSSTDFTLYRSDNDSVPDGSGDTSSTFTSTSGIISITSSHWAGTPLTDDRFKFRTDSNISDDDGDEFIIDADTLLNGMMQDSIGSTNVPFLGTIPDLIRRASMYVTANLIFTSVFSNLNTDQVPTLVRRWYNLGRSLIELYKESIAGQRLMYYVKYGRFVAREPLLVKVGIAEASGVGGMKGEVEAINVSYDEDYNDEETLGTT